MQEGRKNLVVAPDDLAAYTRLKQGHVLQRQAVPLAADFSEVKARLVNLGKLSNQLDAMNRGRCDAG